MRVVTVELHERTVELHERIVINHFLFEIQCLCLPCFSWFFH